MSKYKTLHLDFETASSAELGDVGASNYSQQKDFIVTTMAWAFDDEPVKSINLPGRDGLPTEIIEHIKAGGQLEAWNASFEVAVLKNYFGLVVPTEQISCVMQRSLYAGFPASLGDAGTAMGVDVVKDKSARALMLKMAKPRKATKTREAGWWHEDDPALLDELAAYCRRDVEAERAASENLPELPDREKAIARLDRTINARGLRFDIDLIDKMIAILDGVGEVEKARAAEITGGVVTNVATQARRLTTWLKDYGVTSVGKEAIEEHLARTDIPDDIRELLEIRQKFSKSSVAKLYAMKNWLESDERARGLLFYYGAKTGRWAGRGPQPQNFFKATIKEVDEAITDILMGMNADGLEMFHGAPLDVVASCLRGCILPSKGKKLAVLDLNAIEARTAAWLADQQDIMQVFRDGGDVYQHTSDKLGLGSRQAGKVCMGEGTLVLTQGGWKPIETISLEDLLWDGVEWVRHSGCLKNGTREVLQTCGTWFTPDHLILCGDLWKEAQSVAQDEELRSQALERGRADLPSQATLLENGVASRKSYASATVAEMSILWNSLIIRGSVPRVASSAHANERRKDGNFTTDMQTYVPTNIIAHDYLIALPRLSAVATTPRRKVTSATVGGGLTSMLLGEQQTAPAGLRPVERISCNIFLHWMGGMTPSLKSIALTTIAVTNRAISGLLRNLRMPETSVERTRSHTGSLTSKSVSKSSRRRMRVYDVADCGPRNRYTVLTSDGPLIVHNCVLGLGYSMGPERFVEYAAGYGLELTQERATEIVTQWREANSNISGLWRRIDDCVKEAINSAERSPAKKALVRINAHLLVRVSPARNGQPLLTIQLPSGRRLFYRNIGFDEDPRKDRPSLAFDGYSKMWGRQFTYAAKLFENINQAFARDVLCEMMLEIERRELGEIVLTVHDEVLVEVPDEVADERFAAINEIMNTTPSWAPGLAVKAAGSVMGRYAK